MKIKFAFIFLAGLSILFNTASYAKDGDLDVTFGAGGIVTTAIGSFDDSAYAVAVQSDGKILTAGESDNGTNKDIALVRYNTDGSLDSTFGTGGIVTTAAGTADEEARDIVIQSDGKIVVAGEAFNAIGYGITVVRYNTDGSLDSTFGTGGIVTTIVSGDDNAFAVAIQSDGKIVVAGESYPGPYAITLVRYNTDGSLDSTFGTSGIVTTDVGPGNDHAYAMAIQSDGKILAAGESYNGANYDMVVVRYNTDGSLDNTFGTGGIVVTAVDSSNDEINALAVLSDGKIITAGNSTTVAAGEVFALVRYNTDGSLDSTFGTGGIVTTDVGSGSDIALTMAIQSDEKILVAGYSIIAGVVIALVRYNTNGSLDGTFGTGGIVTTGVSSGLDIGWAITLQNDEKILVAGESNQDFVVMRYLNGEPTTQREILIELYNSTNGDSWTNNSNWKTITPLEADGFSQTGTECSWYGISCDGSDNVIRIIMNNNNLVGTIPASIGNLTNLLELQLEENQLTGSIPPELGNLSNLTRIYFHNNELTSIPPELGNLSNLTELYLPYNQLTSIPPELGNLSNLRELALNFNQLTGSIPPELGNLTNLRYLFLNHNFQLTGSIPPELGNLSNLIRLWLGANQLTGNIPPELGNLSNLDQLGLGSNQLTGSIPPELGNLIILTDLDLQLNQLTGSIPIQLANLTSLEDENSDFRWNGLYTTNSSLETFLNSKQIGGDWQSTQTIAPGNLSSGTPTQNSIPLSWSAIAYTSHAGGYEIYYSTASGGPYTLFDTTADKTVTGTTVTGLTPGTTYYFVLRTVTTDYHPVSSEYSVEISVTTSAVNSPPNIPTVVGPENESVMSLGDVTLQSSAFSDPDIGDTHALTYWQVKYAGNVYRRQDYPASFNFTATSTDLTAHTVTGLVDGMKYEWRVGYVDSDDNARWSRDYAFKVGVSEAANVPMVYPGSVVNEFKMMTLPYWFDDPRGLKVLGVTTYDRTELRVGGYDCEMTPPGYIEADHPQAFANPGEGFWTLARNGLNITAGGIPVTTEMDLEVPLYYNSDYSNGWNQIGPPNTKNYYFQDLEIIEYDRDTGDVLNGPFQILGLSNPNPYIELKIWRWNNGSYEFFIPEDNFLLEKYEAYWVKVKKSNLYLVFRVSAQQAAIEKKKTIMLAGLLRKSKRWFSNWIFVSPQAYAGPDDTPPMPMGGLAKTKEGRGCFIATAAFGSPMQRHVKVLRDFRNRYLLSSSIGKKFVQTYYRFSPAVADVISKHDTLKSFVRVSLLPIVLMSWMSLKLGFIFILAVMFLFACGTIYMIRKKYKVFVF